MARNDDYDVRAELLSALLEKVQHEQFPSPTMLDMIESLLSPDDVEVYAEALLDRIRNEPFPSIPMIGRLQALAGG